MARRRSPSVTVPTRLRSPATTNAIPVRLRSMHSIASRTVAVFASRSCSRSARMVLPDNACGDAGDDRVRCDVVDDDGSGTDDGAIADPDALPDACTQADEGGVADDDAAREEGAARNV